MPDTVNFKPPRTTLIRIRNALAITAAVAALVFAGYQGVSMAVSQALCGSVGYAYIGDECIGATDLTNLDPDGNEFRFDFRLGHIEREIARENKKVMDEQGNAPVVSIGVLMPMTVAENSLSPQSMQQIRDHLTGSYLAQREANKSGELNFRLVLAHEGKDGKEWHKPVNQLIDMAEDQRFPLIAVIGMGLSTQETIDKAKKLNDAEIPMVGTVITADELNRTKDDLTPTLEHFSKVTTSNTQQVNSVMQYVGRISQLKNVVIIHDLNKEDIYTSGLHEAFDKFEGQDEPFEGQDELEQLAKFSCAHDSIAYAGRAALLPSFIAEIRDRECPNDVTVITASDGGKLATEIAAMNSSQNSSDKPTRVHVIYAAHLAPDKVDPDFRTQVKGHGADLQTGWAAMAYDAMQAVVKAAEQVSPTPTPKKVSHRIPGPVEGAGGTFEIDYTTGDVERPMHVMALCSGQKTPELVYDDSAPPAPGPLEHPCS